MDKVEDLKIVEINGLKIEVVFTTEGAKETFKDLEEEEYYRLLYCDKIESCNKDAYCDVQRYYDYDEKRIVLIIGK